MSQPQATRPIVSVVIPSYNHARFLPETIASVLNQTLGELELIIIDDGSRDNSWDIIQQHAAQDSRIVAHRQANAGAHAAINAGLALARGEFLAILNSDDRYHPERLATLSRLANEGSGLDFLCTGQQLVDDTGAPIDDHPWLQEYARMLNSARCDGLLAALLERNFTVSTSNFFIRRALWQALGPIRPLRYNMDWDYALRALLRDPARFTWRHDLKLWDYRLHGENTILGGLPRSAIEANHLIYRSLKQSGKVPASAIAGLRRHYRLIRRQQVSAIANARDQWWEPRVQEAHAGWQRAREESDATHARLGATLTELGQTREQLWQTQAELSQVRQELAAVYASRSYRWGRCITAPLRWLRARLSPAAAPQGLPATASTPLPPAGRPAAQTEPGSHAPSAPILPRVPPYRVLDLPAVAEQTPPTPSVAVHLHVHYTELLDELLDAVANIPGDFRLFVTTTQAADPVAATVHARFPQAQVWQTPNQGKDIGPFIDALCRHRLDQYALVLKLHGKKSRNQPGYLQAVRALFGNDIADGDDWRRKLVAPIAGNPQRILQIWQAFENDPELGMVGAARFICQAPDADPDAYRRLCQRLNVTEGLRFFGGTMFWIRGSALRTLLDAGLSMDDFDPARARNVEGTLEHGLERAFGAVAAGATGYLGGVEDLPSPVQSCGSQGRGAAAQ